MDETPTGSPTSATALQFESEDRRVYARRTVALAEPLILARSGSFHLHLEDREPLAHVAQTFRTQVTITLEADGHLLRSPDGEVYVLARSVPQFAHPGVHNVEDEGWTEFHMDARDEGVLETTADALVIPAGHRLVLEVGLVPSLSDWTPGRGVADAGLALADTADALLPDQGDAPLDGPILRHINASDQVARQTIQQTGRGLGANIDAFSQQLAPPRSTFVADDRGSWLAVRALG